MASVGARQNACFLLRTSAELFAEWSVKEAN
jgi:hypothetical protein